MLFNSNIFICLFLPTVLVLYHILRRHFDRSYSFACLFIASLIFYGYWSVEYLSLLIGSIVVNFSLGRFLERRQSNSTLIFGVSFNLLLLGVFKYANFFVDQVNTVFGQYLVRPDLLLPIGISFFTFQQIAYLVDVHRGLAGRSNFISYGLFVSFFPQLIAGPIVHHKEMMPQFADISQGIRMSRCFAAGVTIFVLGLFKKVVIADNLALAATPMFSAAQAGIEPNFFSAWSGALAYTFQIYFDFSGYSDMAIGLALMFGVRLPANFNSPYKATSIIEFWSCWHMTLSRFLRDYLYFSLGGNRRGPMRRYVNLMLVMLIGGLWHGAGWSFMLWGGLHGFYLIANHAWRRLPFQITHPSYKYLAHAITFLALVVAWVTFRAESLSAAILIYKAMFGLYGLTLPLVLAPVIQVLGVEQIFGDISYFESNDRLTYYIGLIWIAVAAAIAWLAPNSLQLMNRYNPVVDISRLRDTWRERRGFGFRWRPTFANAAIVSLLFLLVFSQINAAKETEFLYFQF